MVFSFIFRTDVLFTTRVKFSCLTLFDLVIRGHTHEFFVVRGAMNNFIFQMIHDAAATHHLSLKIFASCAII